MSQEKVDKYKEYKANREKILKKEKMIKRLEISAAVFVAVVFLGWVGFSFFAEREEAKVSVTTMDTAPLDDYIAGLAE